MSKINLNLCEVKLEDVAITDDCDSLGSTPKSEGGIDKELDGKSSVDGDSNRFKVIKKEPIVDESGMKKPHQKGKTASYKQKKQTEQDKKPIFSKVSIYV